MVADVRGAKSGVREFGGPEVMKVEEVADPGRGKEQVLVRTRAIGVNPYDTYMLSGSYATKPPLPYTPGADAAGVVEARHRRHRSPRDRASDPRHVNVKSYGAYAEKVVCERHQVQSCPIG